MQALVLALPSPLMAAAQVDFTRAVEAAPLQDPYIPILGNVTALPLSTAQEIRQDLQAQLSSRVRWTESIQTMISRGVTTFLELGNGTVLTGLLKRISRNSPGVTLGSPRFPGLASPG
jgi:[acyl-carrier-protein] S-malonyltransferase